MNPGDGLRRADSDLIYLVRCTLNETQPDPVRVRAMKLPEVYQAAERHGLAAAAAFALEKAGVSDAAFVQAKAKSIRKTVLLDAELAALVQKLEQAGIWYMPLKGVLLKEDYPAFGMRQMADYDILFDAARAEDVQNIMLSQGFTAAKVGQGNHDSYHKPPVCNFEMHRALFEASQRDCFSEYYENVKERLLPAEGTICGFRFTPEDFYIFMIAHEYKHYVYRGIGLRALADTYLVLKKHPLNMDAVEEQTEKLGIAAFEKVNRSLAMHLFTGEPLRADEREMLVGMMDAGAYGSRENLIRNELKREGNSRVRYLVRRILLCPVRRSNPLYDVFAAAYPFFYRHKIFLPVLPLYRVLQALLRGREKLKTELRTVFRGKRQ